jgi:hypothetical protein
MKQQFIIGLFDGIFLENICLFPLVLYAIKLIFSFAVRWNQAI